MIKGGIWTNAGTLQSRYFHHYQDVMNKIRNSIVTFPVGDIKSAPGGGGGAPYLRRNVFIIVMLFLVKHTYRLQMDCLQ